MIARADLCTAFTGHRWSPQHLARLLLVGRAWCGGPVPVVGGEGVKGTIDRRESVGLAGRGGPGARATAAPADSPDGAA